MTDVTLGEDAVARLAARASEERWHGALVVMDVNTRDAAGIAVVGALRRAGVAVGEFVFPQRAGLLAGPEEASAVAARIRDELWPVAIGSGVITDIVRYAAHSREHDFVSVPTAASMDGYASSVAAMQVKGVKVTYPARAPVAVYGDPRVAAAAPPELTRAGIGDLLAKATARVDWLASHLLYGEPYDAEVAELIASPLRFAAENASRVVGGEAAAVGELLDGLIRSGLAMARAGSSRPASGCEHHASHFWDLLAARGRREHASHGLQVGYATRFAMRLQRFAFGGGVTSLHAPAAPADPLDAHARAWLGEPTDEIVAAVQEKQQFMIDSAASWPRDRNAWEGVRAALAPSLEAFKLIDRALDAAEIPDQPGYLGLDLETLRATFRFASRLRARYTVIDFLEGQGALEKALQVALPVAGG